MKKFACGLAFALALASPSAGAGAALFQSTFDGPDSETLPEPWIETNEFPSGADEGGCIGASNLRVAGDAMAFVNESGGCDPGLARYHALSAFAAVPTLDMSFGAQFGMTYDFVVPPAGFSYLVVLAPGSSGLCPLFGALGLPPAPIACGDGTIAVRVSAMGGGPTAAKTGPNGRRATVAVSQSYVVVELGPVFVGDGGEASFAGFFGGVSAAPVAAGSTVPFTWSVFSDGVNITAAFPGQEPLLVSTGGGCGDCKTGRWSLKRAAEVGGGSMLFVTDAWPGYALQDLGGGGPIGSSTAKFDNFVIEGVPPLEPIAVRVAAKGKFKKQPINLKQRAGRVPATVFGSAQLDVGDINPWSVRMGASGGETTVAAADWTMTHVDKDGILDMVFNFPKSALATPCGTTSITVTGQTGGGIRAKASRTPSMVPGDAIQPFFGSDSVKVTGCPSGARR